MITIIKRASWDAKLNTHFCDRYNGARLTLTMRMGFRQINPAKGAAAGFFNDYGRPEPSATSKARKIIRWTPKSWLTWKYHFVRSVEAYWSKRFWLINNHEKYEYDDAGVKYIPNIHCHLKIIENDYIPGDNYHHVIDVVNLDRSERFFGSHSYLHSSIDVLRGFKGYDSQNNPVFQWTNLHEVGHLMGLSHVDLGKKHCPYGGNKNAESCYGVSDADIHSIMGRGMQLREKNALPWRRAIIAISGKGSVLNKADWEPKMRRHYPRTHDDLAANRHVILKPKR